MSNYLLSVVLPTKNRVAYLEPTLRAIVSLRDERVEIVVEDNSDSPDAVRELVNELRWPPISWHHTDESRSQTSNSEAAVARATGEYICFIGDDDCITRSLIDVVACCAEASVEIINVGRSRFFWPDVVFKKHQYPALSVYTGVSNLATLTSREALDACLRRGGSNIATLPRVYHGIVARRLLDEVRRSSTVVFPGPSPDMASAVALSLVAPRFVYTDLPVLIDGIGYHSAGGRGARGEHRARLEDVEQLPPDVQDHWESRIPQIWLGPTIWAQSCVTALRSAGRQDLVERIRWAHLYAQILAFHPNTRPEVLKVVPRHQVPRLILVSARIFAWRVLRFVQNGVAVRFGHRDTTTEACGDVLTAMTRVDELVAGRLPDTLRQLEKAGYDDGGV